MALAIHAVAPYATGSSCQEMAGVANTHWRLIMLCDTSRLANLTFPKSKVVKNRGIS
jgi:hypothetical protein